MSASLRKRVTLSRNNTFYVSPSIINNKYLFRHKWTAEKHTEIKSVKYRNVNVE